MSGCRRLGRGFKRADGGSGNSARRHVRVFGHKSRCSVGRVDDRGWRKTGRFFRESSPVVRCRLQNRSRWLPIVDVWSLRCDGLPTSGNGAIAQVACISGGVENRSALRRTANSLFESADLSPSSPTRQPGHRRAPDARSCRYRCCEAVRSARQASPWPSLPAVPPSWRRSSSRFEGRRRRSAVAEINIRHDHRHRD